MIPHINLFWLILIINNCLLLVCLIFYTIVNRVFPISRRDYYPPDIIEMNRFDPDIENMNPVLNWLP